MTIEDDDDQAAPPGRQRKIIHTAAGWVNEVLFVPITACVSTFRLRICRIEPIFLGGKGWQMRLDNAASRVHAGSRQNPLFD